MISFTPQVVKRGVIDPSKTSSLKRNKPSFQLPDENTNPNISHVNIENKLPEEKYKVNQLIEKTFSIVENDSEKMRTSKRRMNEIANGIKDELDKA